MLFNINMKYTVKKIKSLLDEAKVKYTSKMRKKSLVALLTENVDSRYYLLAMTVAQLRDKLRSRKESRCGRKTELIARIWKNETNGIIFEEAKDDHTETESQIQREPIVEFLRLKTANELVSEYKSLTGKDACDIPVRIKTIEDLSSAIAHLRRHKELDDIFKTKLNSDTLSVVMSFLPPDTYAQAMRIRMIEDAEQYGSRRTINMIGCTLEQMKNNDDLPEYIDWNSAELQRSPLFSIIKEDRPANFPSIFAKYYNTYVRGDMSRLGDIYDDLERKMTLCLSSAHELNESEYSLWKERLNYDDRLTMRQRMNTLNKLRPEIDTTVHNRIDMVGIDKLCAQGHYCLDEVTQEDIDNVALLGTHSEIKIMKDMLTKLYEHNNAKRKNKYDELLRIGAHGEGSSKFIAKNIGVGTPYVIEEFGPYMEYPGGNFRKAMARLYGFVYDEMIPYYRLTCPSNTWQVVQKKLEIFLLVAETGIQAQWKMTRDEWEHGRTQERYDNAMRKKIEARKRGGHKARRIDGHLEYMAKQVGKGIARKKNPNLVHDNVDMEEYNHDYYF